MLQPKRHRLLLFVKVARSNLSLMVVKLKHLLCHYFAESAVRKHQFLFASLIPLDQYQFATTSLQQKIILIVPPSVLRRRMWLQMLQKIMPRINA